MKRVLLFLASVVAALAADKQILLVAGKPSHPPGQHEHNAGVLLLTKWLNTVPGIHATNTLSGTWPTSEQFNKADAIYFFSDGGDNHFALQGEHPADINKAAARGAGLMFMHYATEPGEKKGHEEFLGWLGGFFEVYHSVNPIWEARFEKFPNHPITRGVKPFGTKDEWYYNIRFPESPKKFTSILSAIPPADTIKADGLRSGNADVRSKIGQPMTVCWAIERPNGGRSVGLTGGHYHNNLGDENFRKLILNSLAWTAKANVPKNGITVTVTPEELTANLDPKPARRP